MRQIGREDELENINRTALRIAREVADEKKLLFAGGTCNTNIYGTTTDVSAIRSMFDEQVRWSKEEGVDYMIAETMSFLGEAKLALEVIRSYDLPAVITMTVHEDMKTLDNFSVGDACKELISSGATIVGVNCTRGPEMMLEVVKEIVKVCPPEKIGALPVAYRTTKDSPTFFTLEDNVCPANNPVYPRGLEAFCATPVEIKEFTEQCLELGLKYLGICCGNSGELTRTMAESMGKTPPASKYYDSSNFGKPTSTLTN